MTDTTTAVQDDLLGRIAAASSAGRVEELRGLVTQLPVPTPPPSTLRVIDLAACTRRTEHGIRGTTRTAEFDPAYIDYLAAKPDPMTVIDEQLTEWWRESETGIDQLRARIRTALDGAVGD